MLSARVERVGGGQAAELFFFELLCIPRLKPRLQCFVFILEFNARLHDLSENVEVLSYALHDIKRCDKLIKVASSLSASLAAANCNQINKKCGSARAKRAEKVLSVRKSELDCG